MYFLLSSSHNVYCCSPHQVVNQDSKVQQRRESHTVTLAWYACKRKFRQTYITSTRGTSLSGFKKNIVVVAAAVVSAAVVVVVVVAAVVVAAVAASAAVAAAAAAVVVVVVVVVTVVVVVASSAVVVIVVVVVVAAFAATVVVAAAVVVVVVDDDDAAAADVVAADVVVVVAAAVVVAVVVVVAAAVVVYIGCFPLQNENLRPRATATRTVARGPRVFVPLGAAVSAGVGCPRLSSSTASLSAVRMGAFFVVCFFFLVVLWLVG